jgi:WD40 repeat protein
VLGVAFSPDGTLLAAAYSDGYARLWNLATRQAVGAPLPAITGPVGSVFGVAFSPDGKLLATADQAVSARVTPSPPSRCRAARKAVAATRFCYSSDTQKALSHREKALTCGY